MSRTGRCPECGFDWDGTGPAEVIEVLERCGSRYRAPLTRLLPAEDAAVVRRRPEPQVWSALEYAVHVAVALAWYGDRIERVVREERPVLAAYGFDEACERDRYAERDPEAAAETVAAEASRLASHLADLQPAAWQRRGEGSGGDERSVLDLGRRAAHEAHHHLLDVGRVLRRVRGR